MIDVTLEADFANTETVTLQETMREITERLYESQLQNFTAGGRPNSWQVLSTGLPSYLVQSGELASHTYRNSGDTWAEVGNDSVYAAIHQFGGEVHPMVTERMRGFFYAMFKETGNEMWLRTYLKYQVGETMNIKIPQRMFIMFQQSDIDSILQKLQEFSINFISSN